jgi:alkanesulfonate monooxygenase SsuD/methylene tetrahydromethanopterin reductase-like flavin-dependent oxidoreductase (luciferase family)
VESDPITLAKTLATLDHLSGGRVTIGAGFGWNTDELTDHHVPAAKRRTVLKEYLEAMRALWTEEEASYDGEYVSFGPSWAYPKPPQGRIPVIIGAGGGPKTMKWIAQNADGWMTTPIETGIAEKAAVLRKEWAGAGREGEPDVRILVAKKPTEEDFAAWTAAGASELIWGVPDAEESKVLTYLDKMAARLELDVSVS